MNDTFQIIIAVLATVFDMFTTILFYKTCLGIKSIRVNKALFYVIFVLTFAIDFALSQFGSAGLFYIIKSGIIFIGLSMLYHSKWLTRIFTSLSYLSFSMISELISYGIIISTLPNTLEQSQQNYSIILIFNQHIDKIQSLPVILLMVSLDNEQIVSQSLSTTF